MIFMSNFDFETEISYFPSQVSKDYAEKCSVDDFIEIVRSCGYSEQIEALRAGDEEVKRLSLPTFSLHGVFEGQRLKKNFHSPTGIIIVDVDDVEFDALEAHKSTIMCEVDSCIACFISPSGNGLKCLYLVDEEIVTVDNYRQIGREVAKKFEKYGKTDTLSVTDCLIVSCDANILVNEDVMPDYHIVVKESKKVSELPNLEKRDESFELYDDPEEFFEDVLYEEIAERSDNNYHFIQMSVFELAKFGFHHSNSDLSFIVDISEHLFKKSKENGRRLKEAAENAKQIYQTKWPYDFRAGRKRSKLGSDAKKETFDGDCGADLSEDDYDDDGEAVNISTDDLWKGFLDVLEQGDRVGAETSFSNLNECFRFNYGLMSVIAKPGDGKTEMVDAYSLDLSRLNGWKHGVSGFEQTEGEHIMKLVRKTLGFNVSSENADRSEMKNAFDFVTKHFHYVDGEQTSGDVRKILRAFEIMIEKYGCKHFIVDPFNLLNLKTRAVGHEKVNEILKLLVHFTKKHKVLMTLVVHPTKMDKDEKTGKYKMPTFYDAKGSSAFFEMCYHGLSLYRDDEDEFTPVTVKVLKVKQNNLGTTGSECYFRYLKGSGRYVPVTKDGEDIPGDWNKKNWHKLAQEEK